tara:strand:- start:1987 stop:3657 length:1671 start_codon:yes stop_codon:yes gene_type:complete
MFDAGEQWLDASGDPYSGGKLYLDDAGTSTNRTSYKDNAGSVAHTNPIVLDSSGRIPSGNNAWVVAGDVKVILHDSADVLIFTQDDYVAQGDNSAVGDGEWVASDLVPTRTANAIFTLPGNNTALFHVGRRLKLVDSTTVYATITVSSYISLTTLTVVVDGGTALTAALASLSYSLLSADNTSDPGRPRNLTMVNDGAVIKFGADQDVALTHVADSGLNMSVTGNNAATLSVTQDRDDATHGPYLNLTRYSASPANADNGGIIQFYMENNANELFAAAQIYSKAVDVVNGTEDGSLIINTMKAGTSTTAVTVANTGLTTLVGLSVSGNTTLGDAASDTVTVTADVASHLIPSADSTYDIGATASRWRQGFFDEMEIGANTSLAASAANAVFVGYAGGGSEYGVEIKTDASTGTAVYFLHGTTTVCGSISVGSSATAFNTSSDYRLKENVVDMSGAITRLKTLKPKRFSWIADENSELLDGFLAHEVDEVVPQAIHGEKDEVKRDEDGEVILDDDGNEEMALQGIDQSKLVPLLTGALKEAITKIESLEARVAALET